MKRRRYGHRAGVPIDDYRNELRRDFDPYSAVLRGIESEIEETYTRLTELKRQKTAVICDQEDSRKSTVDFTGEVEDELATRWVDATWRNEDA